MIKGLRVGILLAPFIAIVLLLVLRKLGATTAIVGLMEGLRGWVAQVFAWGYVGLALFVVILVVLACVTPLGDVKIGGKFQKPSFSPFEAVAIGVCATTSLGFVYWAAAEPVQHFLQPPGSLRIAPQSGEAAIFARAATFLHWSITAYALYALYMVGFAIAIQNLGLRPSLDELIFPRTDPGGELRRSAGLIDGIAIFCVTLGLAGALASCILALSAEFARIGPFGPSSGAIMALAGGLAFLIYLFGERNPQSVLYRSLARWTFTLMLVFLVAVILLGPTGAILGGGLRSLARYLWTFPSMSVFTGYATADPWPSHWTIAHWSGWMIVAPVAGLFLSSAARGYTVQNAILYFAVLPAAFAVAWIAALGGLAIVTEQQTGGALSRMMRSNGMDEAATYALWRVKGAEALVIGFIAIVGLAFISFAAAALHGIMYILVPRGDQQTLRAGRRRGALIWCVAIALAGWALAQTGAGPMVELVSRVGELPALFITLGAAFAVVQIILNPGRAHRKED